MSNTYDASDFQYDAAATHKGIQTAMQLTEALCHRDWAAVEPILTGIDDATPTMFALVRMVEILMGELGDPEGTILERLRAGIPPAPFES